MSTAPVMSSQRPTEPASLHVGSTMIDLFMLAVSRYPNNIAMRDATGEVTYSELAGMVSAVTQALSDIGVAYRDGVVQMAGNSIVAWAVQVSCYALGARYVGVHRRTSLADARYIIADSGVETIVVDEALHRPWLGEFCAGIGAVKNRLSHGVTRTPGWVSLAERIDGTPPASQLSRAHPEDIARLAYTGGTTGRPKGVVLPHRTLVATTLLTRGELAFGAETRTLLTAPISHGAGNMIMPTLLRGGYIRLDNNFSAETFLATVREEKITTTFLVPTMIYALLDHPELPAADLSSLQLVRYGAAPISPDRLDEALSVFGPTMQQVYGQTEAPSAVATLLPSDHVHGSPRLASIGTPFAGVRVALLNEAGDEVPIGQVGEICVRGPVVMRGYWNLPDETAHVFRGDWLHTGDMAVSDEEGYLFIVDRAKDMIITGGFNIYSREIEDVLCGHPAVASAAVFGIPDPRWGEAVTAAVVRRRSAAVSAAELAELVRSQKGPVASPKRIEFVDALPMTAVGKIDKPALRARYQDDGSQKGDDLRVGLAEVVTIREDRILRLFDIHQHLGSRERLTGRTAHYELAEAVQKHLRYMDKNEIERACLIASHNSLLRSPDDVREVNARIARACQAAPDRLVAGAGTVDPGIGDDGLAEIDYCARELGLPAIAWHTRFQGAFLNSDSVRRYVERAVSLDMTIFLHILGESTSEAAWRLIGIAEEFPQARIVALDAFTSFDQAEWVVSIGGKTSNITYDLSLMFPDAAFIAKFVAVYGADRLVFGTDYYDDMELRVPVGRYAVEMAGLSAEDQDKICWRNASRLLGVAE